MDLNDPAHIGHSNYLISTDGLRAEQLVYDDPNNMLDEHTRKNLLDSLEGHWNEQCGFIDSEGIIWHIPNVHLSPHDNFYMDLDRAEEAIRAILKIGNDIVGIWHTHPNGYPWPSPRDIAGWPNPELGWRYFLVSRREVTEWRLVRD